MKRQGADFSWKTPYEPLFNEKGSCFTMSRKLTLASTTIAGVEAFLGWKHPKLGLMPLAAFITGAEDTGLIVLTGA